MIGSAEDLIALLAATPGLSGLTVVATRADEMTPTADLCQSFAQEAKKAPPKRGLFALAPEVAISPAACDAER